MVNTKICTKCKQSKPLGQFHRPLFGKYQRSWCKECCRVYQKKWYEKPKNKEKTISAKNRWRIAHPGAHQIEVFKSQYSKSNCGKSDITIDDYNKMMEQQSNKCAICGKHQKDLKRRLFIDHCHKTGKIRGLLCNRCNTMLAIAENTEFVLKAKSYLSRSKIKAV